MKAKKRILAMWLALAMLFTMVPIPAFAADASANTSAKITGTLGVTLRFDYKQRFENVKARGIQLTLNQADGKKIGSIPLKDAEDTTIGGYDAQVNVRNRDGVEWTNEAEIGYYDVYISHLPLGAYTLTLEGEGYKTYTTPAITLEDYSQQVIVGTSDGTFTIGKTISKGSDKVSVEDRDQVEAALGKTDAKDLKQCDFNGDGNIDIIDLAYVNHSIGAEGGMVQYDTTLIAQNVIDTKKLEENLKDTVNVEGQIENLFTSNTEAVTFTPAEGKTAIALPIEFKEAVEMEQVEVASPAGDGAVQSGFATVVVENEDKTETTEEIPFGEVTPPENVHAIGRAADRNTVTINLGKRVAVKKITITVTRVEGSDGKPTYAAVEEIKFLKDIVPENPVPDNVIVKNIKVTPGNESVLLTWDELPNITGYRVYYGNKKGNYNNQVQVDTPKAKIKGLKNLTTYYFVVKAISDDWTGPSSEEVSGMPMPNKVPDPPDFVEAKAMDGAVALSWGNSKNATDYKVFYKAEDAAQYQQFGGMLTGLSVNIGSLENNKEYWFYVVAHNAIGDSKASKYVKATPEHIGIEEPAGIPKEGRMDRSNIESVKLAVPSNVDQGQYPNHNFKIENVVDGDYSSHWTSQGYSTGGGQWWLSKQITYTFKDPVDMSYVVYVPRLDGNYLNCMRLYSITVWDENNNKTVVANMLPVKNNPSKTKFAVLPFDQPRKVKKIAINIEQSAYDAVGISEAIFFQYDPSKDLDRDIRNLFTDETYTALVDGVTQEQIEHLKTRLNEEQNYYLYVNAMRDELRLAEALLKDPTATGVVCNGIQSRNAGADSAKYGQAGSDLQPIGVEANGNSEITVYASGIPAGGKVNLIATQNYAEASQWQANVGTLSNGRNVIQIPKIGSQTTPRGGSLYVTYAGASPEKIKLHIRRGTDIPMLELSDWYQRSESERRAIIDDYITELSSYVKSLGGNNLQTQAKNVTELSLPTVLLSLPADRVLAGIQPTGATREQMIDQLYNNVLAWEDLDYVVKTTQGIDKTKENGDFQSRQNIRYMQMFAGAFMYAAGNHVGIGYGSAAGLVSGKPISMLPEHATANSLFGWGIAHEIGHNMDKLGKAEITNNIYSLMAETYDGKENTLKSRLEGGIYEKIFTKVATGYVGAANDVFVQLGMYWQLHLAYDDGAQPMDFYHRFFQDWKAGVENGQPYDDRVALVASKTANRDLTEFFTRWGMQLREETKAKLKTYPKETRAIWYLNDESRRQRLQDAPAGVGTISAQAAVDPENEKSVNLSFQADLSTGEALGYEIIRNGTPIGFTTKNTYVDTIGTADNRAFSYQVKAIDTLGNFIGSAAAGEIRISYDKTIDRNKYQISRDENGVIHIIFGEKTAVSGLKLINLPESADPFTVMVKKDGGTQEPAIVPETEPEPKPAESETKAKQNPQTDLAAPEEENGTAPVVPEANAENSGEETEKNSIVPETDLTAPEVNVEKQEESVLDPMVPAQEPSDTALEETAENPVVSVNEPEEGFKVAKESTFDQNDGEGPDFISYFNKPGADTSDTRIWTYDAKEIKILGIPKELDLAQVQLISYAGDNISFDRNASVGLMKADYRYGDGKDEVIKAGTLVVVGAYRGNPLYNIVELKGKFVATNGDTGEQTTEERPINGYSLLFAEIPADGEVSDISDGLFLFVPDVQKEAELQNKNISHCDTQSLLPAQIKAELYRTDQVDDASSKRLTSDTIWIGSPSMDSMPLIELISDSPTE